MSAETEVSAKPRTKIWVDADACPAAIKEILYRVSSRLRIEVWLVANQQMGFASAPLVRFIQVSRGPDEADRLIAERCQKGDVVITADIPLAAKAVEKGAFVVQPRGELLSAENVGQRLAVRDLMTDLREQGLDTGGPPAFGPKDKQRFASTLDALLAGLLK
jgi:hypothetical protein